MSITPSSKTEEKAKQAEPGTEGRGNERVWKAWKAIKPASHPSHTLWKSLRDYHIPTVSTTEHVSRSKDKNC